MHYEIFSIAAIAIGLLVLIITLILVRRTSALTTRMTSQTAAITKMQNTLKSRSATNAFAQNSEIMYQDLLQQLIPITAAVGICPRETPEHPLWQWAGGLMDEYAKNPYVLEQIRQAIKLDSHIARAAETYTDHASKFLSYLSAADSDGLLNATFSNGLLGQTMTLLAQARQLANE